MRAVLDLLEVAAILCGVGLLGYPVVSGIPRLSRPELAAWAWSAGLLLLAACEGALLLLGLRPDPWKLWGLLAISSLALGYRSRRTYRMSRDVQPRSRIGKIAWIIAGAALILYSIQALSEPMWAWDFVAIWGLKGKTIFLSGGLPLRLFRDPQLAFSHPGYPLMLPTLFAALADLLGSWDTQALALLYPAFELATLLAVFGFLKRRSGPAGAAAASVLTAGSATLYQSYLTGLADIPLALAYVLAGTSFLDALDSGDGAGWRPLAIAALLCGSLKTEGTVFVLFLATTAAVRRLRNRRRSWMPAFVLAAVPLAHLAALRLLRGPTAESRFRLLPARELGRRLAATWAFLLPHLVLASLPAILAIALIFAATRRTFADRLLPALALLAGLFAVAPAFSTWDDPALMARWSVFRIISALVPVFFVVLGARITEGFSLPFLRERPTMN